MKKKCRKCNKVKPVDQFYPRPNYDLTKQGHFTSECQSCMIARTKNMPPKNFKRSGVQTENQIIDKLASVGIPALPGKAIKTARAWADIVAFGCIEIETKSSKIRNNNGTDVYAFQFSPTQRKRGLSADLVLLHCIDADTYHVFDAKHPVFYMNGRMKSGFNYCPGATNAGEKHKDRLVMNDSIMSKAQNRWGLIYDALAIYCAEFS